MKQIDIVDIRKAVKDKQIVFYVKNGLIYCRWYDDNGEIMQVGEVKDESNDMRNTLHS